MLFRSLRVSSGGVCPSTADAKARTASVVAATVAQMVAARAALLADVMPVALVVRRTATPAPPASALDAAGAGAAIDVVVVTFMAHLCDVADGPAAGVLPLPQTATAAAAAVVDWMADVSAAPTAPATAADVGALVAALPLAMAVLSPATATAAGMWVLQRWLPPPPAGSDGSGDHGAGASHDPPAAAVPVRRSNRRWRARGQRRRRGRPRLWICCPHLCGAFRLCSPLTPWCRS